MPMRDFRFEKGGVLAGDALGCGPAIVPDGGDGEDPEGDNDVDTAESDEEGGSHGDFSRLSRCVRWPVPG